MSTTMNCPECNHEILTRMGTICPNCGSQKVNCSKKTNGCKKWCQESELTNRRRGREIDGTKDNNFN